MRPRHKPPLNRKFFHSKRKLDKKDINVIKKKIQSINNKKTKRELEEKKRFRSY